MREWHAKGVQREVALEEEPSLVAALSILEYYIRRSDSYGVYGA